MSFKTCHKIFNVCLGFRPLESWTTHPHIWTFWLGNFEQSGSVLQFLPECDQILHQLLVRRNLVVLQYHPLLLRQSFGTQTSPVQWKLRRLQSRLLRCHHGVRLTYVHQCSKVNFICVSLCFENNLLAHDFLQLPCWDCFERLPFLVHCCFCTRNFHRLWQSNQFVNQIVMGHRSISFACNVVFVIFRVEKGSTRCVVE